MGERAAPMVAVGDMLSNRYVLKEQIGSGGMGTVYRATDLRTAADVAVKVPHPYLANDAIYIERLKREAEIAARVQSPRIARVTDFAEHDGIHYVVMEYVQGDTIADVIERRGAIEPVEALHITLEVARALDAAHQRGVTHRDLKPQNILLDDADVRVLDFGIARAEGQKGLTSAGQLVGSPEYLAPERAEGLGDIRSDLYSLGVVLYQMLAGKVPFDGGTPFTIIRRHANEAPPPLPPGMPPMVYTIVERCLAKRPEDRYQVPRQLIIAVQEAQRAIQEERTSQRLAGLSPGRTLDLPSAPVPRPPSGEYTAPTVPLGPPPGAGSSSGSAEFPMNGVRPAYGSGEYAAPPPPHGPGPVAAPPPPPPAAPATTRGGPPVAALVGGVLVLLLIAVAAVYLLTRGGGDSPAVGSGKATATAAAATATTGGRGTAQPSGTAQTGGGRNSATPTLEVAFPKNGAEVQSPVLIELTSTGSVIKNALEGDPDGRHLHYFIDLDPASSIQPGVPIPVGNSSIVHSSSLNLLQDLPPGKHTITVVLSSNNHVPLAPNVQASVSFTVTGTPARTGEQAPIVYQVNDGARWQLTVIDAAGRAPREIRSNGNDVDPAWSPDGSRLAFASTREGGFHIWVMNPDGSGATRLTSGNSTNRNPAWSPDGSQIAFTSDRVGNKQQIWVMPAGGGEPRQVTKGDNVAGQPTWSADGKQIAHYQKVGDLTQIFVVDVAGGEPRQITKNTYSAIDPAWSPDGRRIAFAAFTGNVWNVWVMNIDGSNQTQVTLVGEVNRTPAWSPDGRQLLFASGRSENQQVWSLVLGGGTPRRVTEGLAHSINPSWPRR